ncbi:MAG: GAF domain-containing protein [Anaerolinea sp.]|nr:GAF domain-containing protein [Anaerolinea sp.]
MQALQQFLSLPEFLDPERARVARALHSILVTIFTAVTLVLIMSAITGRLITVRVLLGYLLVIVGAFALSRRGRFQAASLIVVISVLGMLTYLLWMGNGIRDVAIVIYPIIVVTAGLLLEGRALALTLGLAVLSVIIVVLAEVTGALVTTGDTFTPFYDLAVIVTLLVVTAVQMRFINKDLSRSIWRLRQNEQALAQANRELRHEIAERTQVEQALQAHQIELQARSESLAIINTITDTLHQSLDVGVVAQQAVEAIATTLQIPAVLIYTLEADQSRLHLLAAYGIAPEILEARKNLPVNGSLNGAALQQQQIILYHDQQADESQHAGVRSLLKATDMNTAMLIPLTYLNYQLGVIDLFFADDYQITTVQQDTLSAVAKSISLALVNARYVNQIEIEIQERTEVERTLQAERDFAHQVMTSMGQGLTVTNAQGQFSFINRALTDMLGYTAANLQGKTPYDIAAPNETGVLEMVQQQRRAGKSTTYETRLRHANGQTIDVLITGVPQWQGEEFQGTIAVITDLTERKQAEKLQLRFTNQLRTAVNIAQQMNAILDPEALLPAIVDLLQSLFNLYHVHVYLLDSGHERLYIGAGSGAIGQQLRRQRHAIPISERHSLVARAAREQQAIWVNDVSSTPDFMPNPLLPGTRSEIATPIVVHGAVLGVLDVQDDTADSFSEADVDILQVLAGHIAVALQNANLFAARKEAEARLANLVVELEARNAELERFTYTVSHDLKSPLITIKGFLGLLEQDIAAGDQPRMETDMARIRTAAVTMEHLLHDLLELSRIGRIVNAPELISFADIVAEAQERVAGQLAERNVTLVIASDLPQVYVDRPRIVEVVQNLLDNAIKFMGDQDYPRIEIGGDHRNNEDVLFVRDNGIGIDPRYHEKVFGLFDRLDPAIEGTGIGLALVQRIVEIHNGRIWVESKGRGQGSTFWFTLPPNP